MVRAAGESCALLRSMRGMPSSSEIRAWGGVISKKRGTIDTGSRPKSESRSDSRTSCVGDSENAMTRRVASVAWIAEWRPPFSGRIGMPLRLSSTVVALSSTKPTTTAPSLTVMIRRAISWPTWPAPTMRIRSGRRRRALPRTTPRMMRADRNAMGSQTSMAAASGRPKLPGRTSMPRMTHANDRVTRAPARARASSKGEIMRLLEP